MQPTPQLDSESSFGRPQQDKIQPAQSSSYWIEIEFRVFRSWFRLGSSTAFCSDEEEDLSKRHGHFEVYSAPLP